MPIIWNVTHFQVNEGKKCKRWNKEEQQTNFKPPKQSSTKTNMLPPPYAEEPSAQFLLTKLAQKWEFDDQNINNATLQAIV